MDALLSNLEKAHQTIAKQRTKIEANTPKLDDQQAQLTNFAKSQLKYELELH